MKPEMSLSPEEKLRLFNEGQYACAVPPVCHVHWSNADWMRWIDSNGKWLVEEDE